HYPNVAVVIGMIPAFRIRAVDVGREQAVVIQGSDIFLVVVVESGGVFLGAPGDFDRAPIKGGLRFPPALPPLSVGTPFKVLELFGKNATAHSSETSLGLYFNGIDLVVNNSGGLAIYAGDTHVARSDNCLFRYLHLHPGKVGSNAHYPLNRDTGSKVEIG